MLGNLIWINLKIKNNDISFIRLKETEILNENM